MEDLQKKAELKRGSGEEGVVTLKHDRPPEAHFPVNQATNLPHVTFCLERTTLMSPSETASRVEGASRGQTLCRGVVQNVSR